MRSAWYLFALACVAVFTLTVMTAGCNGKTVAGSTVTLEEAQGVFDAARFTGAATKSPYEFYSAEIFLKKAADEKSLGNDKQANVYLVKAYEMAQEAYENAKRYQRTK